MSALDKDRFVPEESGRLVTAFLERFFERYVSYDYTAEAEEELDDAPAGGSTGRNCSTSSGATSSPRPARSWSRSRREITQALDEFLAPWLYPPRADGSDPRICPQCGNGRLSLRGGKFGAFVACSNYPECRYTQKFGQGGDQAQSDGPTELGDGITAQERPLRSLCRARATKRASIPQGRAVEGRDA